MKTIDKVKVFSFYSLYEKFLELKNEDGSEEMENQFESELKANNCVWDDNNEYIVGYEIDQLFNDKAQSYIEFIEYWKEGEDVNVYTRDEYNHIHVSWEYIYEGLSEHEEYTDTYFIPEEVEKLVNGEIGFNEYTNKLINQFTIDYIKAYILEEFVQRVNSMTVDNLEWK